MLINFLVVIVLKKNTMTSKTVNNIRQLIKLVYLKTYNIYKKIYIFIVFLLH